jgi:cobaltochelatase CobN
MTSQLSNHHAYEYLGGLNMAVKKVTGKSPDALIADVRDPNGARIRDFEEVLDANLRSELLNRKWIEGLKAHGYAGAGNISELVKNTFGWSVTRPESVSQETWGEIYDIYIKDRYQLGLNEWFEHVAPHALQEIAATMLEASRKGIWKASREQVETLSRLYAESVARHGDSGGLVSGGNTRLAGFAAKALKAGSRAGDTERAEAMEKSLGKSAAAASTGKVSGQKLENVNQPDRPHQSEKSGKPVEHDRGSQAPESIPLPFSWKDVALVIVVLLAAIGYFKRSGSL